MRLIYLFNQIRVTTKSVAMTAKTPAAIDPAFPLCLLLLFPPFCSFSFITSLSSPPQDTTMNSFYCTQLTVLLKLTWKLDCVPCHTLTEKVFRYSHNGYVVHLSPRKTSQCVVVSGPTTNIDTTTVPSSSEGDHVSSGSSQWGGRSPGQMDTGGVISSYN